jgi:hypothetical protein
VTLVFLVFVQLAFVGRVSTVTISQVELMLVPLKMKHSQ